jgi:hypothetical protein
VQEAAYASLLRTTRQQYHEKVAQALEQQFPDTAAAQPHLVAHHHTEAGHAAAAIGWWARAAARAGERFASREAVASLRRALDLLQGFPEGRERDGQELGLQMGLCGLLPSVSGYTSAETEAAYLRAQELCDRAGFRDRDLLRAARALGLPSRVRASRRRARAREEPARGRGEARRHAFGARRTLRARLHARRRGRARGGARHLEQGMAADAADPARVPSFHAGMELGVTTPAFSVMPLWLLGRPTRRSRAPRAAPRRRGRSATR